LGSLLHPSTFTSTQYAMYSRLMQKQIQQNEGQVQCWKKKTNATCVQPFDEYLDMKDFIICLLVY
jgi:hypothetical protein